MHVRVITRAQTAPIHTDTTHTHTRPLHSGNTHTHAPREACAPLFVLRPLPLSTRACHETWLRGKYTSAAACHGRNAAQRALAAKSVKFAVAAWRGPGQSFTVLNAQNPVQRLCDFAQGVRRSVSLPLDDMAIGGGTFGDGSLSGSARWKPTLDTLAQVRTARTKGAACDSGAAWGLPLSLGRTRPG